ncbi:7-cyano-7-deazaguanine synthase [Lentzea sp. NEAU-D7]|nr:7-cyano-7-deazaguanine synthase [Lentzea sp. NEAU-D7]
MPKAVVLHSGGLDSATVLAIAQAEGFAVHALTVSYGQRSVIEVDYAREMAARLKVAAHVVLNLDLAPIGAAVPTSFAAARDARGAYCLPARNTLLLSLGLAWMQTLRARDIFLGFNSDYSSCPDHSMEFMAQFQKLADTATTLPDGEHVRLHLPLDGLTKSETIRRGIELKVDYNFTHTCFNFHDTSSALRAGSRHACGTCDACKSRRQGFTELGLKDPAFGSGPTAV